MGGRGEGKLPAAGWQFCHADLVELRGRRGGGLALLGRVTYAAPSTLKLAAG